MPSFISRWEKYMAPSSLVSGFLNVGMACLVLFLSLLAPPLHLQRYVIPPSLPRSRLWSRHATLLPTNGCLHSHYISFVAFVPMRSLTLFLMWPIRAQETVISIVSPAFSNSAFDCSLSIAESPKKVLQGDRCFICSTSVQKKRKI